MRASLPILAFALAAGGSSPLLFDKPAPLISARARVDTVFVRDGLAPIDYDELARRVASRLEKRERGTQVIDGNLVVTGRLSVGGPPDPGLDYALTVRAPNAATIRLISNEALKDPQRLDSQHRHVGTLSLGQDGGLRLEQNNTCYPDERGCAADDKARRHAASGFDSMGDMSFYLSDVDAASGTDTAPRAQSLVFRLIDWDGNIHLHSHRPGQKIYFNGSTTLHAADLQWEVPLR
ncbi:MAG TPA: hypothetical protein VHM24_13115 [Gemmatimonadaceae bacterium]|nr:hypothetical protein [Gemmatimonadaceae bacterium]